MTCVYTFPNGDVVRGKPALKAYLAENMASLLPDRAASMPSFRRTPVQAAVARTVPPEQLAMVERMARGVSARWANPPEVVVFTDMQDPRIPQDVRDEDTRQKQGGAMGEPEGFYYRGVAYLNASEIKTPQDATRVLFHEGLGHYGLRGVFGKTLKTELEQIVALRKGDVLAKARQYGLDTKDPAALLKAAEEVLADMAQNTPNVGFVRRAVAAIRTWLRQNVPGFANMELSDAEIIRDYILPARAFVEQGAQAGKDMAAAAFSRAPSVTSEAFKRWFGDSKVVDAEGKPLVVYRGEHGAGDGQPRTVLGSFTFTDDPTVASTYAERPNDLRNFPYAESPRVIPAYLSIQKPIIENRDDPFVEFGDLIKKIGRKDAERFARKHGGWIMRTGNWEENFAGNFESVDDLLNAQPGALSDLYMDAYPLLDDMAFVAAAEDAGFDGAIHIGNGESFEAVEFRVFRPEQVKSATGNNGNYDPNNPDIRFSRAAPQPTGLVLPEQGLLRRVQAAVQDSFNRVRQIQERIAPITGKPLAENANYYGAETQRPGRIAARLEDFEKQMTGPLMAKLAKTGNTPEQLSELLHAMHAKERNEAVAKINPEMPDGGSGMTTADAAKILAKYKGNRDLHQLADEARSIAKATLDLKLAYGLIDIETHSVLSDRYKYYVPLKGDGEFGPKIKRAMGHDEREEFILQNISRDYQQAIVVGEKNLARQSLLTMVLENPDPELWTVGVPPRGRYVAGTVFSVQRAGKEVATFTSKSQVMAFLEAKGPQAGQYDVFADGERVREFVKPLQENEVPVYVDGQLVRIQIVGDETLAKQLRPLDQKQMGPILEFMRGTNRYLSKIYTGYNPAFIIRNTARDAMTGTINILGNEGITTAAKAWSKYPSAMKALSVYAATGKIPTGEAGKMLQEYRQHGGKTGASWMSDLEQQGKTLERLYDDAYGASGYLADKRYGKAAMVAGRKVVGGMAHVIEVMNQATENGLRLALYMAMRDQGSTPGEAAQAAKSVTVDFDRKGTMSPALGAIYLFFNPAVQGTANAMKTLFKGKKKEQAWIALAALAALGFYLTSQGLDDDEDRWLGESWETRAKNMMINIGGHTIKVPISMEFAPMYAIGVAMAEASRGAQSKMKTAGHIVSSFIEAYFPLQGVVNPESDDPGMDVAMAGVPTILKPGIQIATNRNAFGSQVVPENDFTKDRPDNLKMTRGTKGSVFDATAQAIAAGGEKLGAGRYENDITKVSPETLKLLWRTYTGGLGLFVTDTAGLANVGASASVETGDIPILKDFLKANDVKAIRGRYYNLTKDARAAAEEFRQAKKAGDGEAIDNIMARPEKAELLGFDRMIKATNMAVAAIRDEMVDVNADKSLSLAEKRAKLKELERQEEALYRDAIAAFR